MVFFDDYFLENYKGTQGKAGAMENLSGLSAFMPLDLSDTPPDPTIPVEADVTGLWARPVQAMSANWRLRFSESAEPS